MNRRQALGAIVGACSQLRAADSGPVAIVIDVATKRLVLSKRKEAAGQLLAPPGSTLKPFVLAALLETGRIRRDERFPCSGKLTIEGRSFACVHPKLAGPLDLPTALAYSCNEYVVAASRRFGPGQLISALRQYGLASPSHLIGEVEATPRIEPTSGTRAQLQALGEAGIQVTPLAMAVAYRRLALNGPELIRKGLEDAVEFGTAQHASISGVKVAGKTGSSGNGRWAWFAGFAPSRDPKFVAVVLTQGSSGGADAAPVAGELLREALGASK